MKIKKIIGKDLKDELGAKIGYQKLAKELCETGNKRAARTVIAISHDEADHFKLLTKIKKLL